MKIWFDFTNPPHANFFNPLIKEFERRGAYTFSTAREFVETTKLLELYGIAFKTYGKHGGKNKLNKINALLNRLLLLSYHVEDCDYSFSSNYEAPLISWLKRKKSFVFDDNDISPNWLYSKFANKVISPQYINKKRMSGMGISPNKLITYAGFKENIYIADYKPDETFLNKLPFREFVTVRPENTQATYVGDGVYSIVPELVKKLTAKGLNILFLPRYKSDINLINLTDNIYIPPSPLNGLDVSYYSQTVLTGAGSFSREAAIIGTPAVSFFAGKQFLGVDEEMFKQNLVYHSRNVDQIIKYVSKSKKSPFNPEISKGVQNDLFNSLSKVMDTIKK